jgi:hypothetical protein
MPTRESAMTWLAKQSRAQRLAASLGLTHPVPASEAPEPGTIFVYRGVLVYCYRVATLTRGTRWACTWEGDNRNNRLTYESAILAVDAAEREINEQLAS